MITASHLPSEYNGLKITIEDAKPVASDVLQQIRGIVGKHTYSETAVHGNILSHGLQTEWIDKFKKAHDLRDSGLSVVIDPANMIGVLEIDTFKAFSPDLTVHSIFDTFDHTCPNHEANPIKHETLHDLGTAVRLHKATLGIAFDGDADRVGFVDECGVPVSSDIIGALLARKVLTKYPGATVITDVRSSRSLIAEVERLGGTIYREKVGHTHIRKRMRQENAVLGIELSGHFFFKDTFYSEGGPLPAFLLLELIHESKKSLSMLVSEVTKYYHSGEINSTITRTPQAIYDDVQEYFHSGHFNTLDGLTVEYPDWWCNIRPSANDPVLRLNVEASTKALQEEKTAILLNIIRS
jgi:phosphomannomutase